MPSCRVSTRIPGLAEATGGDTKASEAAIFCVSEPFVLLAEVVCVNGVDAPDDAFGGVSDVMVDCEEDLEKVLARGAR